MKRVGSVWLPDDETDPVMLGSGPKYQSNKLEAALPYVKGDRLAVDVGAHCGLWSVQLGQYFSHVECFEPLPRHIECWHRNADWKKTIALHEVALGEMPGACSINVVMGFSGRSHVAGAGEIPVKTLDEYGYEDLDLLKIDVEGYEYFVLRGGEETLLRCKPVVIVEQKTNNGDRYGVSDTMAVQYLQTIGAKIKKEITGDYIMVWE